MDASRTEPAFTMPSQSQPPPLLRLPGVWSALGLILFYFVVQAVVGFVSAAVVGLGYRLTHHAAALDLHALISRPDVSSGVVMATVVGAAAITSWIARMRWPRLWSQPQPPGFGFAPASLGFCVGAIMLGLLVPMVGSQLTELLAHGHNVPQDVKQLGSGATTGFRIALTVVVATFGPLVEELLFRGVLLSALLRHLRAIWAVLISAALFALVHLPDLHMLWYALPNLALLGMVLAWLRLRANSLWPAVIAHACNNLLAMVALFVSLQHPG